MGKYTLDTIKISQHAKERYAERIMERETKIDITSYILQNEQKIKEDIFKMIEYGFLLYSGKSTSDYNKQIVDVFLNGTWVIIIDPQKNNVITLYSIDLGVGHEFNQQYISQLLAKLKKAKDEYQDAIDLIVAETNNYELLIRENDNQIEEYTRIIKSLQNQNQAYRDVIESMQTKKIITEKNVRDIVAKMIGKKVF